MGPLVPAKAGIQSLALDSRLRGNERHIYTTTVSRFAARVMPV